jgi:hypothetical protein
VLAAVCAVAFALAAHAFGVGGPSKSLPLPEQQTRLAALALEHGGHVSGAVTTAPAPAPKPRQHVTVVHTVSRRVDRVPASSSFPPAQTFVQQTPAGTLPPAGEATAFGCAAALAYLAAYAAPGFSSQCPADAGGHQAGTLCWSAVSPCDVARVIHIAEPCAAAYMNEASNSWVLLGQSDAPIDPYGSCH